jgi:RimJ/RimL family protein N-acetyltransferase
VAKVPHLHTKRLHLGGLRLEDAAAISAYRGLPDVAKYQSWTTFGLEDATQLITDQLTMKSAAADSWVQFMIVLTDSGQPIGDCGIHFLSSAPQQVELGITLDPRHQRHGFASEAIEAVLRYVFGSLNMHRVSATTDANNKAAQILFQRLGFRREAHFVEHLWFKGTLGSEYVFAMLQREWRERPSPHRLPPTIV